MENRNAVNQALSRRKKRVPLPSFLTAGQALLLLIGQRKRKNKVFFPFFIPLLLVCYCLMKRFQDKQKAVGWDVT